jgi:hypothetical protein
LATKDHLKAHVRNVHEVNEKKLMKDKIDELEAQINFQNCNWLKPFVIECNRFVCEKIIWLKGKCNIDHTMYNWRKKYG